MADRYNQRQFLRVAIVLTAVGALLSFSGMLVLANMRQNWETLGSNLYRFGVTIFFSSMCLTLMGLLMNRLNRGPEVSSRTWRDFLFVGPIQKHEYCSISADDDPVSVLKKQVAGSTRHRLRIIVAQKHVLEKEFFYLLGKLDSLVGLDIQNCRLQDVPLDLFSELWRLEWLLVHNTVPDEDRNGLAILLPAVAIHYEPLKLQVLDHPSEEQPAKQFPVPSTDYLEQEDRLRQHSET